MVDDGLVVGAAVLWNQVAALVVYAVERGRSVPFGGSSAETRDRQHSPTMVARNRDDD